MLKTAAVGSGAADTSVCDEGVQLGCTPADEDWRSTVEVAVSTTGILTGSAEQTSHLMGAGTAAPGSAAGRNRAPPGNWGKWSQGVKVGPRGMVMGSETWLLQQDPKEGAVCAGASKGVQSRGWLQESRGQGS